MPVASYDAAYSDFMPLTHWLTVLNQITPAQQLTILGAGNGNSALLQWASELALANVNLAEAGNKTYTQLKARWQPQAPRWQFHNVVIETGHNDKTYYTVSNPSESGLIPPITLAPLWPNLTSLDEQPSDPRTLKAWATEHWQETGQWLVIDYFCDATLLSNNSAVFDAVEILVVRVSTEKNMPEGLNETAWQKALQNLGFRVVAREAERHPRVEQWLCIRQPHHEIATLQSELAEVKQKLEDTHTWFMNRKQQALSYEQQIVTLEQTLKATQEELAQARHQAAQLKLLKETLDQLDSHLAKGFSVQSEQRQQATNALGKHLTQLLQSSQAQQPQEEKDNL
ncbi:hypothetical protein [Vreelandella sp. H-I2]